MSTHHGFIKCAFPAPRTPTRLRAHAFRTCREFPFIRVDAFDGDPARVNPYSDHAPLFYLLTHSHTDHFVGQHLPSLSIKLRTHTRKAGLDSPTFEGEIFCTPVTRHLVLNTMEAGERVRSTEIGRAHV